jgi:thioredoxin reductase (NADPH)
MMVETEVILVGAGPIGLELAVALQQVGVDYVHLEARQIGHTISWFPRQARFFSSPDRIAICGVPLMTVDQSKATREEYLAYLLGIAQQFRLPIQTYERVTSIQAEGEGSARRFRVSSEHASGPRDYRAKKVILTIGDMHRPRPLSHPGLPEVPGADLPHVSHYFEEPHPFVGQQLLIVGGRNSAVEAAIRCHRAGAQVSLSYRRGELDSSIKYWLKPEIEFLIRTEAIRFHPQTVPTEITPTTVLLAPVDAEGRPSPNRMDWQSQAADFVLLLIGYQMDCSLLAGAAVDLRGPGQAPALDPQTMETNVSGLYVAGTAAGGSQRRYRLFIENSHAHVARIVRHLTGQDPRHINPLAFSPVSEDPLVAES